MRKMYFLKCPGEVVTLCWTSHRFEPCSHQLEGQETSSFVLVCDAPRLDVPPGAQKKQRQIHQSKALPIL